VCIYVQVHIGSRSKGPKDFFKILKFGYSVNTCDVCVFAVECVRVSACVCVSGHLESNMKCSNDLSLFFPHTRRRGRRRLRRRR